MAFDVTDADDARAVALPWPAPLPWQQATLRDFAAARGQWPHALLIHGPRGIGKHALALHLAQTMLCETPAPGGTACGTCAGCRYAVAGQHPDLMRVELLTFDPDEDALVLSDGLGIDRIRALIDFVQLTSHRGRAKVAVIAPAERMNTSAANALLKTLEEPPRDTFLLLVTEQAGRLPATIVSRCRKLAAPVPDPQAARAWLAAHGAGAPGVLLAQAGGGPLAALALSEPAVQQERAAWLRALADPDRLVATALAARVEAGGRDERKARLAHALDWMVAWTADLARVRAGGDAARNPDFAAELGTLGRRVAALALFRYHRSLLRQRALVSHPLQPRLVAEALLIDYRALF